MLSVIHCLRKGISPHLLKRPSNWSPSNSLRVPRIAALGGCRPCSSENDSTENATSRKDKSLAHTSVFVQDGIHIEELPCIVRVVEGEFTVHDTIQTNNGTRVHGLGIQAVPAPEVKYRQICMLEEDAMVSGFSKCSSLSELCSLLCQCPDEMVTPAVALHVIKNLIQLENNRKFRNPSETHLREQIDDPIFMNENFTRAAIMDRLMKTVCRSTDPQIILDTVKALQKDTSESHNIPYMKLVCDECLLLISESKLSLSQIASLAQDLYLWNNKFTKSYLEKLWTGLEDDVHSIDEKGLSEIFSMLPYLHQSRQYVFHMAEKRALAIWYKLSIDHVIQILSILVTCQCNSRRLLGAISRWMNVNIHTLSEGNLRWIMLAFNKLQFMDYSLEKALTRYTKAKKSKITDPALVSAIMEYCLTMRYRSPPILEICADFFINNYSKLTVPEIWTICYPFGELNYLPKNSSEFFKVFEIALQTKFPQFPADLLVDLLLMCVYLERYPLNFTKRVYHPFFFQRIHQLSTGDAKRTRAKLGVLDKAMKLEASCYQGPMIAKSFPGAYMWMHRDVRVVRCINRIKNALVDLAGDPNRILLGVVPPGFPSANLYRVDCLLDPNVKSGVKSMLPAHSLGHRFALVVQLPDHYDMLREHLLGPQALRERHFKLAGLTVVNLDYDTLNRFINMPTRLKHYVVDELTTALNEQRIN